MRGSRYSYCCLPIDHYAPTKSMPPHYWWKGKLSSESMLILYIYVVFTFFNMQYFNVINGIGSMSFTYVTCDKGKAALDTIIENSSKWQARGHELHLWKEFLTIHYNPLK